MAQDITPLEARGALDAIDRGRRRVIDEIDLPAWYWWGLALGWIGLGVSTDLNHPWLTGAATLGAIYERAPDFIGLVKRLDPRGAFCNPWLEARVLGVR